MELVATSQPNPSLAIYRPRQPWKTPLYQLLDTHYDHVKGIWDDRFEKIYGRWRGFVDKVVARYLDCAIPESGFARLKCDSCGQERLASLPSRKHLATRSAYIHTPIVSLLEEFGMNKDNGLPSLTLTH